MGAMSDARALAAAMGEAREARGDTRTATVSRVADDGTVYVRFPGSAADMPVHRCYASVAPGDSVAVTIRSGRATVGINASDPAASSSRLEAASTKADTALAEAARAKSAADSAESDAARAKEAADDAVDSAGRAEDAAGQAQASATSANRSANAALDQLSVVQDVAGILTWASEQGAFARTADAAVVPNKVYFTYSALSGDYSPVVDPQAELLPTYYELDMSGGKQAMNEYILAHLAVTSRGLWVLPSGKGSASDEQHASGYKMLLSSDGCYIYDGSGVLVRSDTASGTDFAEGRSFHFGSDDAYILYTPAHGSTPAQITIGGANVVLGESRTLSELIDEVDGSVVFKVSDEYSQDGSSVTLTAHVYKGGVDTASQYPDSAFAWYRKNEDGSPEVPLGNGRTLTLQRSAVGFGAAVKCRFTPAS